MSKILLSFLLLISAVTPVMAALPVMRVADPRLVDETRVIGGHIVHFVGLTPTLAAQIPRNVEVISIDGRPPRFYHFPLGTNPRAVTLSLSDPNQGNGNNPSVQSVTAGDSNILIGPDPENPTVALEPGITLTGSNALTLSSATSPTISGGGDSTGNAGLVLLTSAHPLAQAFLLRAQNAPGGKLLDLQVGTTSKASVDASGNGSLNSLTVSANGTTSPAITCVGATFPCEIESATGSATDAVVIDNNGTCTGTSNILNVTKALVAQFQVLCNGNIKLPTGNLILTTGTGITVGQTTALAGTNTIGCVNSGASTCSFLLGVTTVPTVGDSISMKGHLIQRTNTNLGGSCTLTGTPAKCTVTFTDGFTGTSHPICPVVEENSSGVALSNVISIQYNTVSSVWTSVTVYSGTTGDTKTVDVGPCMAQDGS